MNPRGAVFLSYASQDAGAAREICEALRGAGVEVWFDQSELRGGDAWDARIRSNIRDCALFIPVISRHTQERAEGYFRLEWHLAEQRTYLMASDEPFLAPVAVDDVNEQDARVPDRFRERQWTRIPGKPAAAAFAERIARLLAGDPEAAPRPPVPAARGPAPRRRSRRALVAASLAAAGLAIGAAALWMGPARTASPGPAAPPVPARSPVDDLIARAATATGPAGSVTSRQALDTAGSLLEQAKSLDPTNGEVWSEEALNDLAYIADGYDISAERKGRVTAEVERAMAMAPHSFKAREAHAFELLYVVDSPGSLPQAEAEMKRLIADSHGSTGIAQSLGIVLRNEGKNREAAAVLIKGGFPGVAAWEYLHLGDWKAMDAAADLALKKNPLDMDAKLHAELYGFEDADAARRTLGTMPLQEMLRAYPASMGLVFNFMLRDPQKMLDIAHTFPGEWISTWYVLEPKAAWEGSAYRLLGQADAARAKWQFALKEIDDRLAATPDDDHLILLRSDMYSELGRNDEAAAGVHLYEQLQSGEPMSFTIDHLRWLGVKLRLGQRGDVMKYIGDSLRHPVGDTNSLHGEIRFDPDMDPLRADPAFRELMRETKPGVAKPLG
ncbi:MAG TPA: toll/interleukin-1 receptor domain-containing protein [Opitutaceae bacterium]